MSESEKQTRRDFSKFDRMPTADLEEILRQDALVPPDESDVDLILYILDVLEARPKEHPDGTEPDVDAAWESFLQNYRPTADEKSLYDDEERSATQEDLRSQRRSRRRAWLSGAAVAVVLLFAGTLTAHAAGFDLWKTVVSWTDDVFTFSRVPTETTPEVRPSSANLESGKLQFALDRDGVTDVVEPTYLPEGYRYSELKIEELVTARIYTCIYTPRKSDAWRIAVSFSQGMNGDTMVMKDEGDPEIYERNGTQYYIVTNVGRYSATWVSGAYTGSISGVETRADLIKMIDSMEDAK